MFWGGGGRLLSNRPYVDSATANGSAEEQSEFGPWRDFDKGHHSCRPAAPSAPQPLTACKQRRPLPPQPPHVAPGHSRWICPCPGRPRCQQLVQPPVAAGCEWRGVRSGACL
jgi:hypothetical protein